MLSTRSHGDRDRFLDKHPEFEGRGEGYASHYDVPAATSENVIVEKKSATIRVNLQGIAIGNGLVTQVDATHVGYGNQEFVQYQPLEP
ncbi:putative serine protease family S10 [Phytophthora cinnamomi]|uniref:putative serine protease family S10 n=1 Tax=Phytophthora cinnamomi TaxID=4785 RepID=UPI003559B7F8|nr:putative serine protease family S10 [Phytophthora cinnamomi]